MIAHIPVLLGEAVEQLAIDESGIYVDGTFGRGGHSGEILSRLGTGGKLLAMDRDSDAVCAGEALAAKDSRFLIEHESFERIGEFVERHGVHGEVSGVLLDLGVSSPQLDEPERGFSFQSDGALDMRMDQSEARSAGDWINSASQSEIVNVLFRYGEESAARRIARAICRQREEQPIESTRALAELIESVVPRRKGGKHPATKTFQAIRIYINRELEALERGLAQCIDILRPGGRLCVISFHSLEDRIVKRFMRDNARIDPALARLPVVPDSAQPRLRLPARAIRPTVAETDLNPRARSATLRVAERLS